MRIIPVNCVVQYLTSSKCSVHVSNCCYLKETALVGRNRSVHVSKSCYLKETTLVGRNGIKLEVQLGRTEASGTRQGAQEEAGLGRGIFSLKLKIRQVVLKLS